MELTTWPLHVCIGAEVPLRATVFAHGSVAFLHAYIARNIPSVAPGLGNRAIGVVLPFLADFVDMIV